MSAVEYSPSSSVSRGSDHNPPALSNGGTQGIAGRLALKYRSPGVYEIEVFRSDDLPDVAMSKGKMLITGTGDDQVLSFSDGTAWRALKLGAML